MFKLRGTRNGVVIEDSILLNVIDYDIPLVKSKISIKNLQKRINLNDQIYVKFDLKENSNPDNVLLSAIILFKKEVKKIIILDYNKFRFQVWEYFDDLLDENQNGFSVRFSIYDPMYIMPN